MTHDIAFTRFCDALGELMTTGLGQANLEAQMRISDAVADGGTIFAVATCAPAKVVAYLRDSDGKDLELFQVSDGGTTWAH